MQQQGDVRCGRGSCEDGILRAYGFTVCQSQRRFEVCEAEGAEPWRSAILLIAGDKSGQWRRWYRDAIPAAEELYAEYLEERQKEIADEQG